MKLLLAHPESPWCRELAAVLREEFETVEQSDNGRRLALSLKAGRGTTPEHGLIIAGGDLAELSAIDAIHESSNARDTSKTDESTLKLILVTDVRSDDELLALLRRRGIAAFIYRDDALEKSFSTVTDVAYAALRETRRYPCEIETLIEHEGRSVAAEIRDLSPLGCLLVAPLDRMPSHPAVGSKIGIRPKTADVVFPAEVRMSKIQKKLFRSTISLGVKFIEPPPEAKRLLDALLRQLAAGSR